MRQSSLGRALESLLAAPGATRAALSALFALAPIALLLTAGALQTALVLTAAALLVLAALLAFDRLLKDSHSRGYEILEQDHEWDLTRPDGSLAIHRKRLRLRYLNQTISIVDFAWGDGNLFAEYSCEPGRIVDRFLADHQLWVLISLGGVRRRGQEEEFTFRRAITDGFLTQTEWIEANSLEGGRASLKLVFPKHRPPESVSVVRRRDSLLPWRRERFEQLPASALEEVAERRVLNVRTGSFSGETALQVKWTWPPIGVFISSSHRDEELAHALASYLGEHGITSQATDLDATRAAAQPITGAAAVVLIVGSEPADDQLRSEWSTALEEASGPEPRPVAVLLPAGAKMPASLRTLPAFCLERDPERCTATFERLRDVLWQPAALLREADIRPDRRSDHPPARALAEVPDEGEIRSLEKELESRREELEADLRAAEQVGDLDARRRSAYALGIALSHLGEPARASEMLRLAIGLTEAELGQSHPAVADGKYNLAAAYERLGRWDEAVDLIEQAIRLGRSSLGEEHPKVRAYQAALEQAQPPPPDDER
jgi:tetratricopeptide (TPR) repeat protein